jgi:AmmeMemoRadiSam system protein A
MSELAPLSSDERQGLLWLARTAIVVALRGAAGTAPIDTTTALLEPCGAFVTVYHRGELRGCVGTIDGGSSLYEVVPRMARAAALDDHRFTPLSLHEMDEVRIEISRLGPMQLASIHQIDVGVHGVCLEHDGRRAVFLPKVAREHGWDRSALLTELCRKAYLHDDAWMSPATRLFTFTAEVFDG